ncbi:MAG: methyltransferase domain-containing protein [Myxococcota bacterium]
MTSPFENPALWTSVATGYDTHARRITGDYSARALELAKIAKGQRVLDVACGPGTLVGMALDRGAEVTAVDFAPGMVERCQTNFPEANALVADGQNLPFEDEFDAAFSCFGLIFFPDRAAGFRSLLRSLVPGGAAVVTCWSPIDEDPLRTRLSEIFYAAFPSVERAAPPPDALNSDSGLRTEMEAAGFANVEVVTHEAPVHFGHRELWDLMAESFPPITAMRSALPEVEWHAAAQRGRAWIAKHHDDAPLSAVGYLGLGRKG